MKVVINKCFGGFSLSYKAVMRYAEIKKIKLFAFVEKRNAQGRLDFKHYMPYEEGNKEFLIHYSTKPLKDETYQDDSYFSERDINRADPALVQVVQEMGDKADGDCASLKIIEIPDDVKWQIEEYDGLEHIAEEHETWS